MNSFEKIEKNLFSSYESILTEEGKEICKEIDSLLTNDNELLIEKANAYCLLCTNPKRFDIDEKIVEKCRKFLLMFGRYRYIKNSLRY